MDTFAKKIRDLTKYIPIITIILFFFSFVGNFTYYDKYGISIIDFFESSDYLGMFFDDLIYLAMYLFVIYVLNQLVQRKAGSGFKKLSNQIDDLQGKFKGANKGEVREIIKADASVLKEILKILEELKKYSKRILKVLYYLFFAIFITLTGGLLFAGMNVFIYFLQAATVVIILRQIDKTLGYLKSVGYDEKSGIYTTFATKKYDRLSDPIWYLIYFSAILSTVISYNSGISNKLSFGRSDRVEYIMHVNDSTINTNDSLIYLGSTKNYLFLYDKSEDKSIVHQRELVEEFEVINKPKSKRRDKKKKNPKSKDEKEGPLMK